MEIQPIVIGTAGHIDHGKSTLVRALTGIDPDRLKEEKERGLTIDLGFAPLPLPDGRLVGIVDVPGHERFIRNMVAGATGIDMVVLVVAADDGVMPQTREHLQIMEILGVGRGMIALTKVDAVEAEMADFAEEDVRDSVRGTFLEGAPILRVAAPTGQGLPELKEALFAMALACEPRPGAGVFRMPVQRVFSMRGFGTVVTGIPVSGEVRVGDMLEILPGGVRGKVRGLNAYRQDTDRIRSGHSSAINFSDVDQAAVQRGFVVATPGYFSPQRMVAARINVLADRAKPLADRTKVRVHTGTADPFGEIVLLDKQEIAPGESGLVQLRLSEPVVCAPGDRFVLRLLSPVLTLGGGVILEESRYRLKRFKDFVIHELSHQEASLDTPEALLESILARRGQELSSTEELATAVKRSREETREHLGILVAEGRAFGPRPDRWIHADAREAGLQLVRKCVEGWFQEESHRTVMEVLELRRRSKIEPTLLSLLLEVEAQAGRIESLPGGKLKLAGRSVELPPELEALAQATESAYGRAGFQPPSLDEVIAEVRGSRKELERVVELLVDGGRLTRIAGDQFMAQEAVDSARAAVVENCEKNGHLVIPELRDRLGTTRKYLIPLLEYLDAQGVTLRQGGNRVLRRR